MDAAATAFPNILQNAYDTVSQVRDTGNGLKHWNDAWSNFMVNYALSEYEFKNNKEMWNLMNEYNSPAEQMKRFKEAGLNPMLVYQQGTPGNASSQVNYTKPNIQFTPNEARNKDLNAKLDAAMNIIGVVSNLADNIGGMIDQGLNIQLKKNQVAESNFDRAVLGMTFPGYGDPNFFGTRGYLANPGDLMQALNPLSPNFDVGAYMAFARKGQLPQFLNQYYSAESARTLQKFKSDYQDYYNKNLLPKFEEFQQGKLDLQGIEKVMNEYHRDAMMMIPPEWRGILEPVLGWLAPFVKFIFKSSRLNANHTVKTL